MRDLESSSLSLESLEASTDFFVVNHRRIMVRWLSSYRGVQGEDGFKVEDNTASSSSPESFRPSSNSKLSRKQVSLALRDGRTARLFLPHSAIAENGRRAALSPGVCTSYVNGEQVSDRVVPVYLVLWCDMHSFARIGRAVLYSAVPSPFPLEKLGKDAACCKTHVTSLLAVKELRGASGGLSASPPQRGCGELATTRLSVSGR